MRPLEILAPLLLGIYLLGSLAGLPRGTAFQAIPGLVVIVIIVHLIREKYRWQMVPLYALSGTIFIGSLVASNGLRSAQLAGWPIIAGLVLGLVLLAIATALPSLLPVPRPAAPTGPYRVGTRTYALVDEKRKELYSGKSEPRRFIIQVWYPALPDPHSKQAPWMAGAKPLARAISVWLKLPFFFLDHISLAQSNSFTDAPIDLSAAPFPLLLFSHGWGGFRAQNTYQVQELASHGYVVVGMEHPYGALISFFPDGRLIHINHNALPYQQPGPGYDEAARLLGQQWAEDMSFTLDYLSELNANDPEGIFRGLLDLQKVGVLGHSTGGGAIVQLCANDLRCRAGFAEDVYMPPVSAAVLEQGLSQPFSFMFSQVWANDTASGNNQLFHQMIRHNSIEPLAMHLLGSNHYDFTDLPALSPLAHWMGLKGPIKGKRVQKIVNAYSRAFFDLHLKGLPSTLLDGPSTQYPEVIFEAD